MQWREIGLERSLVGEVGAIAEELQAAGVARWCRFSASSTRKAATYWQRILTAGIPDGVKTRRAMRQGGAVRRDPEK
jgi:hypothetical protein